MKQAVDTPQLSSVPSVIIAGEGEGDRKKARIGEAGGFEGFRGVGGDGGGEAQAEDVST